MTVDTSQNVGIGTASPATKLQISSSTGPSNDDYGFIQANYTGSTTTVNAGITVKNYQGTSQFMQWDVNGLRLGSRIKTNTGTGQVVFTYGNDSEAMRIDTSGNLLVGTTNGYGKIFVSQTGNNTCAFFSLESASGSTNVAIRSNLAYTTQYNMTIEYLGVTKGSITNNGSNAAFNTSSDYRLKENVQPLQDAVATIKKLRPVSYDWIGTTNTGEGFLAHELAEVIPNAVHGVKDAVNEDGSINPQQVDYSKLTAHLAAAIKELSAKNDALEARLAALEAK